MRSNLLMKLISSSKKFDLETIAYNDNAQEMGNSGPNILKGTFDGALQFKATKYGRETLPMSRKRILWHLKVGKESNPVQVNLISSYHSWLNNTFYMPGEPEKSSHFKTFIVPRVLHRF